MGFFPGATSLLKRVIHKKSCNSVIWWSGICFFKGLCLFFSPNVPWATFIQGATLIPEYRLGFKQGTTEWGEWAVDLLSFTSSKVSKYPNTTRKHCWGNFQCQKGFSFAIFTISSFAIIKESGWIISRNDILLHSIHGFVFLNWMKITFVADNFHSSSL